MVKRFFRKFTPARLVYILSHVLVLAIGFGLCMSRWASPEDAGGAVVLAVGASLVAVGVAGVVLYLHVLLSQENQRRQEAVTKAGIERVFGVRSVLVRDEYDSRLGRASKSIDILGFGLRHLLEDHGENFREWARRARVRMLVIDPEAPIDSHRYADQRDLEEGNEVGQIRGDVERLVRSCRELLLERSVRFEIRLYTCLPSVNVFRIDDDVFWGPYFVGGVSRNMPTFLLQDKGFLPEAVLAHFESIWSSPELSREVPAEWLEPKE